MTSRATRPTPNQTSWRTATLPPARPMWRLASVVALRRTRPPTAPSSGQSTFCNSRRSMPTINRSPADVDRGDLLEKDRVVDLPRDRCCRLAAVPAALHEHDHHDLRVLDGREGDEPGVVLALGGLRVRDRLRGARL